MDSMEELALLENNALLSLSVEELTYLDELSLSEYHKLKRRLETLKELYEKQKTEF